MRLEEEGWNRLTVRVTMPRIQQRPKHFPLGGKLRFSSVRRPNPMVDNVLSSPRPCSVITR
jgi:hypothetical protein